MIRAFLFLLVALALAGCARPVVPVVVASSPEEISVSAWATPRQHGLAGEMAAAHCAKFGRRAQLGTVTTTGIAGSTDAMDSSGVLKFQCR